MRLCLIIASAAVALASAAPSAAADRIWQLGGQAFNVHLDDLNLGAASGRAQALARVEAAAVRLCRDAGVRAERRKCEADVVNQASALEGGDFLRAALAERAKSNVWLAQAK